MNIGVHGKRLKRVTEPGHQVLQAVEIILREVGNLKRIGEEFGKQDAGRLSIATTHTQARYVLPEPVALLRKRHVARIEQQAASDEPVIVPA